MIYMSFTSSFIPSDIFYIYIFGNMTTVFLVGNNLSLAYAGKGLEFEGIIFFWHIIMSEYYFYCISLSRFLMGCRYTAMKSVIFICLGGAKCVCLLSFSGPLNDCQTFNPRLVILILTLRILHMPLPSRCNLTVFIG